jgi:hypothetical protein
MLFSHPFFALHAAFDLYHLWSEEFKKEILPGKVGGEQLLKAGS